MKFKTKTRWVTAIVVVATLVVLGAPMALPGFAPEEGPGWPPFGQRDRGFRGPDGPGFLHGRMLRQLDLSDDQLTQLRGLRDSHFDQTKIERDKLREARIVFQAAIKALEEGHGDTKTIRSAARAMADTQAELAIVSSGFRTEFLDILTAEQIDKMKELRAEAEARMKDRTGERRPQR